MCLLYIWLVCTHEEVRFFSNFKTSRISVNLVAKRMDVLEFDEQWSISKLFSPNKISSTLDVDFWWFFKASTACGYEKRTRFIPRVGSSNFHWWFLKMLLWLPLNIPLKPTNPIVYMFFNNHKNAFKVSPTIVEKSTWFNPGNVMILF